MITYWFMIQLHRNILETYIYPHYITCYNELLQFISALAQEGLHAEYMADSVSSYQ